MSSFFKKPPPPPKTPISGFRERINNVIKYHWRGVLGIGVPLIILPIMMPKHDNETKVMLMWILMFWFFLIRPINIPVTGLVPIYYLPMLGILPTVDVCRSYINENVMLFLLSGMLILLLNNSAVDRRIILHLMTAGNVNQFSAEKLVYKCSTAAFFLSIFSSRLITASIVTEYFTKAMMDVEEKFGKGKDEANLKEVRYVVNNAIQVSSGIGSIAIVHSTFAILTFRSMFCESVPTNSAYPDIFNYLQYSVFAVPVACVMFVLNLFYFMFLAKKAAGKPITTASMEHLQNQIKDNYSHLPTKMSLHEHLTIVSTIVFLALHITRWSEWLGGWAAFRMEKISQPETPLPTTRDATCAAMLVVILHMLPSNYSFLKYFTVSKRSQLPPPKMTSSILWWKFTDKNLNYGYTFLIGSGTALLNAARKTELCDYISAGIGSNITSLGWNTGTLIIILLSGFLSNIVSATAACISILPFVLCAASKAEQPWPGRTYLAAVAIGISSSFGFCYPFLFTPGYFCYYVGKVPLKKMVTNAFISVLICIVVLWLAILFYAPLIWDPEDKGIFVIQGQVTTTTVAGVADNVTETTTVAITPVPPAAPSPPSP